MRTLLKGKGRTLALILSIFAVVAFLLLLVLSIIGAFALLILHGVLYPGDGIPAFGDIFSMFSELAGSGIWFFLIGIMIGFGLMIATVIGEALED